MLFFLCCAVLVPAAVLGGATAAGHLGDVVVQFLSVPLLTAALWPAFNSGHPKRKEARVALALCGAAALVIVIEVLPLPAEPWREGGALLSPASPSEGAPPWPDWHTISLTPEGTWAAAASLIVPLSIFGAVMQLSFLQRRKLAMLLLGVGALSLGLGFVQIAQGPTSGLRFYEVTNLGEAVGFFANRNHYASFLSITLLLAGMVFAEASEASLGRGRLNSRAVLKTAAAAAFAVAVLGGLAVARSRAGIVLAMLALAGVCAILIRQPRPRTDRRSFPRLSARRFSIAALLFGILFVAQFGLGRLLTRFDGDSGEDLRPMLNRTTWETAVKVLPFGTGLGSFVPVYAAVEKEQDIFPAFANRAHNDFAELFLETGLIGALLVLSFLAWFLERLYRTWKQSGRHPRHVAFERGATVAILLLLAHSAADYPLRTAALSAVFAFFCGILAAPSRDGGVISRQKRKDAEPAARPVLHAPAVNEKWTSELAWPKDWRRNSDGT